MPPVLGPLSRSKARLWSWQAAREDRVAVGQGEHAGFVAVESFLDHDLFAGVAEFFLVRDAVDCVERLVALSQTKTPLPAAMPSALTTTGVSSRSVR